MHTRSVDNRTGTLYSTSAFATNGATGVLVYIYDDIENEDVLGSEVQNGAFVMMTAKTRMFWGLKYKRGCVGV